MDTGSVVLIVTAAVIILMIIWGVTASSHRAEKERKQRNAINNTLAGLIEKKAITASGSSGLHLKKDSTYKTSNALEHKILTIGFENRKTAETKAFHTRLRKKSLNLRDTVESLDPSGLDFETKPRSHVSNSSNDDVALVLPLVVLGGLDGSHSDANPSYAGDSSYSSDFGGFDGSGGSFGGDSGGGGGDGGGGGGGD